MWNRRRLLQAALAGTGAAWLPWRALSAEDASSPLLRAGKDALVIGNAKYRNAPLRNPVNDAADVAATLKDEGFAVTLGLDLTRQEMHDAIGAFSKTLSGSKAVGLFYFAGHGAQLAWRNYLIPVDGDIVNIDELRDRAVDVNSLIEGIRKAGNPMNLIILDACRDNPFGGTTRLEQKGLSQLDAPTGTLLAYATAPGHTAIDGDGRNGLYTENLLREMKVPEAKVEDVFKRVRLAVRRRSNGAQIPWESTSLEQDFWFIPPKALRKLADAEIERDFELELALWEKIQHAAGPEPLEGYLVRFPSGRFAELAQLQLDRVLAQRGERKVEVAAAPENPYSKGTVAADTAYKAGDTYWYRQIDILTKLEGKPFRLTVTAVTDTEVIYNKGMLVTDLLGNTLRLAKGAVWSPNQTVPTDFAVGKRWNTRFRVIGPKGIEGTLDLELRITGREQVTVPAGTFNAFRVEARGWRTGEGPQVAWDWKTWYAPDQVRRPIAAEVFNRTPRGKIIASHRNELTAYHQS